MREIRRQATSRFRRYFRHVWMSRGGGFYGFVAALMFVYLEGMALAGDVAGVPALLRADLGGLIGWGVANILTAVFNLVKAAVWPIEWIGRFGVGLGSGLLLAGSYAAYRAIRPAILRLLGDPANDLLPRGAGAPAPDA
mgnify:CR=1 FL=1